MKKLNQSGSHIVALAVGLLVVGVIGFAGYKVSQASKSTPIASNNTAAAKSVAPSSVNNRADLTQAAKSLDDSASQVNGSLNDGALSSDLNDML